MTSCSRDFGQIFNSIKIPNRAIQRSARSREDKFQKETNLGVVALHVALAGALAGLLHVVSGPDHLVAIAPLSMKRPWLGLRIGIRWGLGHASGVLMVGVAGVSLRAFVDIDSLSRWAEFVVGFVLIGVGVWAIAQMRHVTLHKHAHRHAEATQRIATGDETHPDSSTSSTSLRNHRVELNDTLLQPAPPTPLKTHCGDSSNTHLHSLPPKSIKSHVGEAHDEHVHSFPSVPTNLAIHAHVHVHVNPMSETKRMRVSIAGTERGAFLVGLLHGAAGTGHLLGVVPTLSLPPLLGVIYLASYGVAAVFAMGTFGMSMGLVGNRLAPATLRRFMLGSGIVAIGLGLFWLYSGWNELSGSDPSYRTTWGELHPSSTMTSC